MSASSPPSRLISDELWALAEPLIPPRKQAVHGRTGRPRIDDRDALEGIAYVLSTGIGWAKLPRQLGYGSGWTCWRRMCAWAAGRGVRPAASGGAGPARPAGPAGLVTRMPGLGQRPRQKMTCG